MDNKNGTHHLESRTPTISKIISSNIVHERAKVMLKTNNTTQWWTYRHTDTLLVHQQTVASYHKQTETVLLHTSTYYTVCH